ncbi:MAG: seg [Parcubacteria group bacterium]|nr:seg [Parcubacteria group bacterium]
MDSKGHQKDSGVQKTQDTRAQFDDFVLEKGIFSNIFEKDIRRVYIYKKAERLAKAIHLVAPAFRNSLALRDRMDKVAVGLVDAAILPPAGARDAMSRELLALSSVLSIARTGGLLSPMNADLIAREAHQLLQEIATYEEPRLFLEDAPSLAELARDLGTERNQSAQLSRTLSLSSTPSPKTPRSTLAAPRAINPKGQSIGQIKDKNSDRREAIRSILSSKGASYIKDISTLIRDVSEKTIQRELQAMVESGELTKSGERRWTTYTLA